MAPTRDLNKRAIYLISDHLDRILAAGEDLVRLRYAIHATGHPVSHPSDDPVETVPTINAFVHQCREHELGAIAAIICAREHTEILGASRTRFSTLARLFSGATAAILDTIELTMPPDERSFSGDDPIAFLHSRGLLAEEMGCLKTVEEIVIDEDYLIAGCIHLGALLNMTAAFLDAIEVHFDLFPDLRDSAAVATDDQSVTVQTLTAP